MRPVLLLLTGAVCAACSREKAGNASASAYTSVADSSAREDSFAGTNTGAEFDAPRLIPAIQNQLNLMASGAQQANPENLTAYKNMAGDLINSMIADLSHAGYADSASFKAVGDSVLDELGGGAGTSSRLDQAKLPRHIDRMRGLITRYQQTMRKATTRE